MDITADEVIWSDGGAIKIEDIGRLYVAAVGLGHWRLGLQPIRRDKPEEAEHTLFTTQAGAQEAEAVIRQVIKDRQLPQPKNYPPGRRSAPSLPLLVSNQCPNCGGYQMTCIHTERAAALILATVLTAGLFLLIWIPWSMYRRLAGSDYRNTVKCENCGYEAIGICQQ